MTRPDALGLKTAVCGFSGCCVRGDFEFLARQKIHIGGTVYVTTLLIPNPRGHILHDGGADFLHQHA